MLERAEEVVSESQAGFGDQKWINYSPYVKGTQIGSAACSCFPLF